MALTLVFVLLLMLLNWHEPFVHEPHTHVEVTVEQNQLPAVMASGGFNGTAKVTGLRLTASVGTPVAFCS
jgi:hypothetical protein